jgi:hypothetical protein
MPLLYFDLIRGRSSDEVHRLLDSAHAAVVEAFSVPERDRYQVVNVHSADDIIALDTGLGIDRSERRRGLVLRWRPRPIPHRRPELR